MSDTPPPADRPAQYLFVCVSQLVESPPEIAKSGEEVHKEHVAYLQDLFDQGKLFGSGPQQDASGARYGGAVLILQNIDTFEDAREIALREPNVREGLRTMEVFPWRRVWFGA